MTATSVSPLSEVTGYRLIKLGEVAMERAEAALKPLGIPARHLNVLATVAAQPTLSQRELSTTLGIDQNVMVGVIDDLERRELAHRERSQVDRRRHVVVVTKAGHDLITKGSTAVAQAERDLLEVLSSKERSTLHVLCGKLLHLPANG